MREKKTSKVGQSNGIWGLLLAFAIPFFTITAMVPSRMKDEGMLARVARVIRSHKILFIVEAGVCVITGVAFGRLGKGGRVLADATDFGDLDRL